MKKAVKFLAIILVIAMMPALVIGCGGEKHSGNKIPDVFGVNYTDAIEILEADGYEVKVIETSVEGISEKLLYPLENVKKGEVFKIDDYILDSLGDLNKNYDAFYEGELISDDKSVVIYYAKEDYIAEKDEESNTVDTSTESSTEETPMEDNTVTESKKDTSNDESIDPDFKAAMDSYETFMNEYVSFMKKYSANPTDISLIADYADYMSKYSDFVEDFEAWEDEELNNEELAYYVDVQARVSKKLLEVAQ